MPRKDLPRRARSSFIPREVGRDKDRTGAEAFRPDRGHGGANPVPPRLVGGGAYDGTIPAPGDNDGFAAQARVIALFDGSVERVHVNVHDLSKRRVRAEFDFDLSSRHIENSRSRESRPLQMRPAILSQSRVRAKRRYRLSISVCNCVCGTIWQIVPQSEAARGGLSVHAIANRSIS